MTQKIPPTAANGKFPYPHRTLRQVAYDVWIRLPKDEQGKFLDWLESYHG